MKKQCSKNLEYREQPNSRPALTELAQSLRLTGAPGVAHLMLKPGQVRWCLTWFGLKAVRVAADVVELMGVNPQLVGDTCDQIRHSNGGLFCHRYGFHRLVALKTQEMGQSHWWGVAFSV